MFWFFGKLLFQAGFAFSYDKFLIGVLKKPLWEILHPEFDHHLTK